MWDRCETEEEWDKVLNQLELPPQGYTGSLAGTAWDPAAIAADYAGGY